MGDMFLNHSTEENKESRYSDKLSYKRKQESLWAGEFGDAYIRRNMDEQLFFGKLNQFTKVLAGMRQAEPDIALKSALEFGPNIGLNLLVLRKLLPGIRLCGVEINENAAKMLQDTIPDASVYNQSIFDFDSEERFDLVFTAGVLIHIQPEELNLVYDKLYHYSNRFILISEYYNPTPVQLTYKGESEMLFKRDFAGELLDRFKDLKLVDYDFVYHRDPCFPLSDVTWFLLRK